MPASSRKRAFGIYFGLRVLFCASDAQLTAGAGAEARLHRLPVGGKGSTRHERLHAPGKAAAMHAPRTHPVEQRRRTGKPPRKPVVPAGDLDVSQQPLRRAAGGVHEAQIFPRIPARKRITHLRHARVFCEKVCRAVVGKPRLPVGEKVSRVDL